MSILRTLFISLSHNRPLRRFMEKSWIGSRLSSRFVAGMEIDDALRVAKALNGQGIAVTLDSLGESVTTEQEARRAAGVYHALLDAVAARNLDANISVKLTQMGLESSKELAESIAEELVRHAHALSNFVRIDMEGSALTESTLEIVYNIHAKDGLSGAIGVVVQAYLYRTRNDIETLISRGIRVRICKGAYKEPASVAYPLKADVDANYLRLATALLDSGFYHGIATHDETIVNQVKSYAKSQQIEPARFEFQMLYGVRRDLQTELVREGYKVRVYLPFGREWYPYFMRRLAERPANLFFLVKNLFRA